MLQGGEKRSDVIRITSDIIYSTSDVVFPMSVLVSEVSVVFSVHCFFVAAANGVKNQYWRVKRRQIQLFTDFVWRVSGKILNSWRNNAAGRFCICAEAQKQRSKLFTN